LDLQGSFEVWSSFSTGDTASARHSNITKKFSSYRTRFLLSAKALPNSQECYQKFF
jgi:hypothetical protein